MTGWRQVFKILFGAGERASSAVALQLALNGLFLDPKSPIKKTAKSCYEWFGKERLFRLSKGKPSSKYTLIGKAHCKYLPSQLQCASDLISKKWLVYFRNIKNINMTGKVIWRVCQRLQITPKFNHRTPTKKKLYFADMDMVLLLELFDLELIFCLT